MKAQEFITEGLRDPKDNPCWKGYKPVGTKKKAGKTVPNCVPKEGIEEAKSLNKRVRVVKTGETGTIRQVKHGAFKGAPKSYFVDLDNGKQADNLPASALRLIKDDVAEEYNAEYDDEAGMADNNLETLERAVQGIDDLIDAGDNLPEWCQEKIAIAKSILVNVWDYMRSEEDRGAVAEDWQKANRKDKTPV